MNSTWRSFDRLDSTSTLRGRRHVDVMSTAVSKYFHGFGQPGLGCIFVVAHSAQRLGPDRGLAPAVLVKLGPNAARPFEDFAFNVRFVVTRRGSLEASRRVFCFQNRLNFSTGDASAWAAWHPHPMGEFFNQLECRPPPRLNTLDLKTSYGCCSSFRLTCWQCALDRCLHRSVSYRCRTQIYDVHQSGDHRRSVSNTRRPRRIFRARCVRMCGPAGRTFRTCVYRHLKACQMRRLSHAPRTCNKCAYRNIHCTLLLELCRHVEHDAGTKPGSWGSGWMCCAVAFRLCDSYPSALDCRCLQLQNRFLCAGYVQYPSPWVAAVRGHPSRLSWCLRQNVESPCKGVPPFGAPTGRHGTPLLSRMRDFGVYGLICVHAVRTWVIVEAARVVGSGTRCQEVRCPYVSMIWSCEMMLVAPRGVGEVFRPTCAHIQVCFASRSVVVSVMPR